MVHVYITETGGFAGCFSPEASSPFAGTTRDLSGIALSLYGVMYAYDGW